ncbi:MAG: GerMN domain-containing protein [Actinomycetota bacterium]
MVVPSIAVVAACGVPESSPNRPLDFDAIPEVFSATTTTTPPTTTSTPSESTTTPPESTSSTVPVEQVTMFFVAGSQVVPISRLLLSPAAPPQVLAALVEGLPEGDVAAGLRSAIPFGLATTVTVERGSATVDLPDAFVNGLPGAEQRLAVAQIVLTLTRRAGIGQVVFTSGNRPQAVPRGRGDLTQPGELVACDDYSNLLPTGFSC